MTESDRVTQALDNFWAVMDKWVKCHSDLLIPSSVSGDLARAYREWLDASKPPGDPHKEWVDAEKVLPPTNRLVLVKRDDIDGPVTIGKFYRLPSEWHIQPFETKAYMSDTVRHWRYIPEMED